ncbi:Vacuolar protein sorting/targeting protein 10 [Thelohanellus kitauei]|uniref:Vacuolar protein sorting/targeting protein 10 n=1 Tax=Thelohanellus kitauei TaxID=669202 RepID=A0A0C2IU64_THEKT|nr:Vacuolar protein sorting/targeting protein 10 [Thelohanellus kitauei]
MIDITTELFHAKIFGARADMTIFKKVRNYFYLHGNLYVYVRKYKDNLCLYTFNKYDQMIKLICHLATYDDKCSFVTNPHIPNVIYANFKLNRGETQSYISVDNGKNFEPIKFKDRHSSGVGNNVRIEFDLECRDDYIQSNFPEKFIIIFKGSFHTKGSTTRHIFISVDDGLNWNILGSRIEKLILMNRGGIMLGIEYNIHRFWYSYDYGFHWMSKSTDMNNLVDIIAMEFPNNPIIAAFNYDKLKNIYTLYLFSFSHLMSRIFIMKDRTCQINDFEHIYVSRYSGTCYQGQQVYNLKKKRSSMCVDNRKFVPPHTKPCPCSIEDFDW